MRINCTWRKFQRCIGCSMIKRQKHPQYQAIYQLQYELLYASARNWWITHPVFRNHRLTKSLNLQTANSLCVTWLSFICGSVIVLWVIQARNHQNFELQVDHKGREIPRAGGILWPASSLMGIFGQRTDDKPQFYTHSWKIYIHNMIIYCVNFIDWTKLLI